MTKMGNVMHKMMGAHYGDNQFDFFDFIPLIAILVGSALLLSGEIAY